MAQVNFILQEVLKKKGITQTQLSEMTSIRPSTISDLPKRNALNLAHLATICEALEITDIRELLKLEI